MSTFSDYKILKWHEQNAQLITNNKDEFLVVTFQDFDMNLSKSFKNLKFIIAEEKITKKQFITVFGEKEALLSIGESINELKLTLWESLLKLNKAFKMTHNDILKFRGDLAEAIFLYFYQGTKLLNNSTADILFQNKLIEIKSVSNQKNTITISKSQILENTEKYAVYLFLDNKGLTISEIAQKIKGNTIFVEGILKKYKNTKLDNLKFRLNKPINITSKIPKLDLPNSIISAEFVIQI